MIKFYPFGILATGALLVLIPEDALLTCLQQILLESSNKGTNSFICLSTKTLTQLIGFVSILCALVIIITDSKNVSLGALIGSSLLALGIFFIYLVWPGFCKSMVVSRRYTSMYIAFAIAIIQLLMSIAGIIKTTRVKSSTNASG